MLALSTYVHDVDLNLNISLGAWVWMLCYSVIRGGL